MRAVEEGSLRPSVVEVKEELKDRAPSEGPRWTRAVGDQARPPLKESNERAWKTHLKRVRQNPPLDVGYFYNIEVMAFLMGRPQTCNL